MCRRISIRGRVRPSVRPSVRPLVRPSVPCYFRRWKLRILGAFCAVYPAFLDANTHLYKRSCLYVRLCIRPSVRPVLFSIDKYGRFWGQKVVNSVIINEWRIMTSSRIWCTPALLVQSLYKWCNKHGENLYAGIPAANAFSILNGVSAGTERWRWMIEALMRYCFCTRFFLNGRSRNVEYRILCI